MSVDKVYLIATLPFACSVTVATAALLLEMKYTLISVHKEENNNQKSRVWSNKT